MVYRGKPSAGCENCRKAKKRCGLEQPACERCVKLKKICTGYRDTTSLQIQDESEATKRRTEKQKATPSQNAQQKPPDSKFQRQGPLPAPMAQRTPIPSLNASLLAPPSTADIFGGYPTPGSIHSDSTPSSDSTIELDRNLIPVPWESSRFDFADYEPTQADVDFWISTMTRPVTPKPEELATKFFFDNFTIGNHWGFLKSYLGQPNVDPCLELAVKACGMAGIGNLEHSPIALEHGRSFYTVALGLLNETLRDPRRCKTDDALMAVGMLGRYENLMCENRQSIHSWKAHIRGSTQLLKVRGKAQFKTERGRLMYREMRNQAVIATIWDDEYMAPFFRDYDDELSKYPTNELIQPIDQLIAVCFDLADLRAGIRYHEIPYPRAAAQASELEQRFMAWDAETMAYNSKWSYSELEVENTEHVYGGKVHSFGCIGGPVGWNTYRSMRIMLTRTQEWLSQRLPYSAEDRLLQKQEFQKTRRQMTDDICASVPIALGHGAPAFVSPCPMVTAYGVIWPLFFAGTCALERAGPVVMPILQRQPLPSGQAYNQAGAQAEWIISRLEYIADHIGLKWADGVAAVLRGDFVAAVTLRQEKDAKRKNPQYTNMVRAHFLKQVQESQRDPRFFIDVVSQLNDEMAEGLKEYDMDTCRTAAQRYEKGLDGMAGSR